MFGIEPFNSGHIECGKDKSISPLSQQLYLYEGDKCTAKPNQGFEFVSWQENLQWKFNSIITSSICTFYFRFYIGFFPYETRQIRKQQ